VWGTDGVVEVDVAADGRFGLALIDVQIHIFVLDLHPDALCEYIATPTTTTIHADSEFLHTRYLA
jgi:hypothetical protein